MKKSFYPPKGGWPTNVMVPSERVALVTARLRGKPLPKPLPQWIAMPQLSRHVLAMQEAMNKIIEMQMRANQS